MKNKQVRNSIDIKEKAKRPIDKDVQKAYSWWKRTFITIRKSKARAWKTGLLFSFVLGVVIATVWTVSLKIQTLSNAANETSKLFLDPSNTSVAVGESFDLDVVINTNNNNIVVARAVINYNPANFELVEWNTDDSAFVAGNTCVYNNKPCEIVKTSSGMIDIVVAKPSPGVKTDSGKIATLTFKVIATNALTDSIDLNFSGIRGSDYADSDMILDGAGDNGAGTDILAETTNATVTVGNIACNSFTYGEWGTCQPGGTRIRNFVTSLPAGCVGGNPVLAEQCEYVAPSCSYEYTEWSECQPNNTQSRTVAGQSPNGCSGGNLETLQKNCSYIHQPVSTSTPTPSANNPTPTPSANAKTSSQQSCTFEYANWSICQPDGMQYRTVSSITPDNCTGGNLTLLQGCTYTQPTCDNFNYSDWSKCQSNNTQIRNIINTYPSGCIGGNPVLINDCDHISSADEDGENSTIITSRWDKINVAKPSITSNSHSRRKLELSKKKKFYSQTDRISFRGSDERLINGVVKVYLDKNLEEVAKINKHGKWKARIKTYYDGRHTIQFKYFNKDGKEVDKSRKYEVRVDTEKPEFIDLPSRLNKQPGDKVWWRVKDESKLKYEYYFNGNFVKTRKDSFVVPARIKKGNYRLKVIARDKAGNEVKKTVTIKIK